MIALFVMIMPLLLGFCLIVLIARFAPSAGAADSGEISADIRPEIPFEQFRGLIDELIAALDLDTARVAVGRAGAVEMALHDPRPLAGGRILLQATPQLAAEVEASEVLSFAEVVSGEVGARKGILIALAGFTAEARVSASDTRVALELIDGSALLELARAHLSAERAHQLAGYRGLGVMG